LPVIFLAANLGRHCGKHIEKTHFKELEELCVGHQLEFQLTADYFPPDNQTFLFTGPRSVHVYDTFQEGKKPLHMALTP
jgi:hypothetical protein